MRAMLDSLSQPFFGRALIEAVLVGVLAGVVGVHVLLRRLPFFVVAMSHATFPGVVIASMLGTSLFLGGSAFGLLVVVLLVLLGLQRAVDDTSLVGVVLAGSFAVGILLQSVRSGGSKELSAFLVGSILTVTPSDVVTTAVVGGAVLLALALAHKELVLTAFDPGGAAAAGYRLRLVDLGVLAQRPTMPEPAPRAAAITMADGMRSVHSRAVRAGTVSRATARSVPTAGTVVTRATVTSASTPRSTSRRR